MEIQISLFLLASVHLQNVVSECPVSNCFCYPSYSEPGTRSIDCSDDKDLHEIPHIRKSEEVFNDISFKNSNISAIRKEAFKGLRTNKIDLSGNHIRFIDQKAFSGLNKDLKYLYLQGNGNINIPYYAFQNLSALKTVTFENFIQHYFDESFPLEIFLNVESLSFINIHAEFFGSSTFAKSPTTLRFLEFRNNPQVSTFPVAGLCILTSLNTLIWSGNNMYVIPMNAFRDLIHLQILDLSSNKITTMEKNSFALISERLNILKLGRNSLDGWSIQTEFSRYVWKELRELDLSSNFIKDILNRTFKGMTRVEMLNLSSNLLETVTEIQFVHLKNLIHLDLDKNHIISIDLRTFVPLTILDILSIRYQVTGHKRLQFQGKEDLTKPLSIHILKLQGSKVSDGNFWNNLRQFSLLRNLIAESVGLSLIYPGVFKNLSYLSVIRLDDNHIEFLDVKSFGGLEKSLQVLSLKDNKLRTVEKCMVQSLVKLEIIDLSGNSIHCDCNMKWLSQWLRNKMPPKNSTFQNMKNDCKTPEVFRGISLLNLTDSNFMCSDIQNKPQNCFVQEFRPFLMSKHFQADVTPALVIILIFVLGLVISLPVVISKYLMKQRTTKLSYALTKTSRRDSSLI